MKWTKRILGLICVLAGTLLPHAMYAMSEDGNLWNLQLFVMMLIAAITSFTAFAACRFFLDGTIKRFIIGAIASYAAILILLLAAAGITGEFSEVIMWIPVILLFGVPFMAPLVIMSGVGSLLVMGNGKPEPATPPYSESAVRPPQG
ncbi:MAG TPA: hypothetical protein PLS59_11715 [Kiritimatiellia bacterium]|jgi:hypothetical protein|nr:hypothetical protein [Kiritimatiellia bacterium]